MGTGQTMLVIEYMLICRGNILAALLNCKAKFSIIRHSLSVRPVMDSSCKFRHIIIELTFSNFEQFSWMFSSLFLLVLSKQGFSTFLSCDFYHFICLLLILILHIRFLLQRKKKRKQNVSTSILNRLTFKIIAFKIFFHVHDMAWHNVKKL